MLVLTLLGGALFLLARMRESSHAGVAVRFLGMTNDASLGTVGCYLITNGTGGYITFASTPKKQTEKGWQADETPHMAMVLNDNRCVVRYLALSQNSVLRLRITVWEDKPPLLIRVADRLTMGRFRVKLFNLVPWGHFDFTSPEIRSGGLVK